MIVQADADDLLVDFFDLLRTIEDERLASYYRVRGAKERWPAADRKLAAVPVYVM